MGIKRTERETDRDAKMATAPSEFIYCFFSCGEQNIDETAAARQYPPTNTTTKAYG